MRQVLALLFCFAATCSQLCHAIINGTTAPIESYPFIVSMQWDQRHKCGGTLLDATTVLTAAHCIPLVLVNASQPQRVSVLLGSANQLRPRLASARRVGVERYIWHPSIPVAHRGPQILQQPLLDLVFDYALVKLAAPVWPTGSVAFAHLPSAGEAREESGDCEVLGWGRYASPDTAVARAELFSPELRRGRMRMTRAGDCEFPSRMPLTMACVKAIFVRGQSQGMLCFGDSGSPVLCRNGRRRPYITGFAEAAMVPCNAPTAPAILMRIQPVLRWIAAHVQHRQRRRRGKKDCDFR